ncbi:hypothetical protein EJ03DRAFT_60601 [Teratosphaeria nubilosa]|uniref:Uncharacterized protein n=1 Tax=Teratosphaeria nubilosa TaxID=161662 RepID=A0A6G1LCJ7_9PEZI|nr:hypothetical protein EJ03DRAFT_60601 [Teratosphaeria nubilosa]
MLRVAFPVIVANYSSSLMHSSPSARSFGMLSGAAPPAIRSVTDANSRCAFATDASKTALCFLTLLVWLRTAACCRRIPLSMILIFLSAASGGKVEVRKCGKFRSKSSMRSNGIRQHSCTSTTSYEGDQCALRAATKAHKGQQPGTIKSIGEPAEAPIDILGPSTARPYAYQFLCCPQIDLKFRSLWFANHINGGVATWDGEK